MIPGEILPGSGDIEINAGRAVVALTVRNTGDRPVQVGSHFHFAEANAALEFDRRAAWGHRLAVPAGTSVRFEPGMPRDVELVALAGNRIVPGLRGLAGGPLDAPAVPASDESDPAAAGPATSAPSASGPSASGRSVSGPSASAPTAAAPSASGPSASSGEPENGSPR